MSSIKLRYGYNANQEPIEQFLVFKQSEKLELIKAGFKNALTIHEYQGKQADHIVVVRTSIKKEDIYNSKAHCLVAISRHRRSFRYIASSTADTIDAYCLKSIKLTRANTRKFLVLKGGGDIVLVPKLPERMFYHQNICSCTSKYSHTDTPTLIPKHFLYRKESSMRLWFVTHF